MMRPATIFLGIWRRGDGLARAEEGSGEESARASAFSFGGDVIYRVKASDKIITSLPLRDS